MIGRGSRRHLWNQGVRSFVVGGDFNVSLPPSFQQIAGELVVGSDMPGHDDSASWRQHLDLEVAADFHVVASCTFGERISDSKCVTHRQYAQLSGSTTLEYMFVTRGFGADTGIVNSSMLMRRDHFPVWALPKCGQTTVAAAVAPVALTGWRPEEPGEFRKCVVQRSLLSAESNSVGDAMLAPLPELLDPEHHIRMQHSNVAVEAAATEVAFATRQSRKRESEKRSDSLIEMAKAVKEAPMQVPRRESRDVARLSNSVANGRESRSQQP